MVEFAFVVSLLLLLLFGLITFGLLLAVRQTLTQAAAEGARAAVPVTYSSDQLDDPDSPPVAAARTQAARAADWIGRDCDAGDADDDGLTCDVVMHDCDQTASEYIGPNDPATSDCLTVVVILDQANHPMIAPIPLLAAVTPDRVSATAVVQLDNLLVE